MDTTRADHLACYGNRGVQTPILDELARTGVLCAQAITPVPATLPGHASLLTGLYPYNHGARANGTFKLADENVTLADRRAAAVSGFLRPARERNLARSRMNELQIRAVSTESLVSTLSGGNQQKVLLARWMSRPQRVIVFDEPTRGVDVGAKYEIYLLINRLAAAGVAIVMISSELPEVIGMADRVGVMHEGRLVSILDNRNRQVTQEQIMRLAAGEDALA